MAVNMGQIVVDAWDAVMREHERRDVEYVTTLHDWRKRKNHAWIDDGWMRPRPDRGNWLFHALAEDTVK